MLFETKWSNLTLKVPYCQVQCHQEESVDELQVCSTMRSLQDKGKGWVRKMNGIWKLFLLYLKQQQQKWCFLCSFEGLFCFVFLFGAKTLMHYILYCCKKNIINYPAYSMRNMYTIHASFYPYRNVSEIKFACISGWFN